MEYCHLPRKVCKWYMDYEIFWLLSKHHQAQMDIYSEGLNMGTEVVITIPYSGEEESDVSGNAGG